MNTLSHRGISLITNAANANWLRDPKEIEIQEGKLMEYVFFLEARVAGLEALLEKYEITNSKKKNEIRLKEE